MKEEQATAENSSECSNLHGGGGGTALQSKFKRIRRKTKLEKLRGSRCLPPLPKQHCILTAKEKQLAAPLYLAINSKQKKKEKR